MSVSGSLSLVGLGKVVFVHVQQTMFTVHKIAYLYQQSEYGFFFRSFFSSAMALLNLFKNRTSFRFPYGLLSISGSNTAADTGISSMKRFSE